MNLSDLSPARESLDDIAMTTSKARKVRGIVSLARFICGTRARPLYAAFRERLLFFHFLFASYMLRLEEKETASKHDAYRVVTRGEGKPARNNSRYYNPCQLSRHVYAHVFSFTGDIEQYLAVNWMFVFYENRDLLVD